MQFTEYMPPMAVLLSIVVLSRLRFENQRWVNVILSGRRGSSQAFATFVLVTGLLGTIFYIGTLAFLWWFAGLSVAVGTFALNMLIGIVWSLTLGAFIRDTFMIWLTATLAIWPVSIYVAFQLLNTYL